MTKHSEVKYKCKYCDTPFVPIPQSPNCPKCNRKSKIVFGDFVKETLDSARFNLSHYGKFVKMWLTLNIGDSYYLLAFRFLDYVCSELTADKYQLLSSTFSKAQIDLLTSQFLNHLKFNDQQPHQRHVFKTYFSLLLQREAKQRFKWLGVVRWVRFHTLPPFSPQLKKEAL